MGCCSSEDKGRKVGGNDVDSNVQRRVDQLFAKYDKNNSGSLDEDETLNLLNDILKDHNQKITKKQLKNFMKTADKDGNGVIDKEEILNLYRRLGGGSGRR